MLNKNIMEMTDAEHDEWLVTLGFASNNRSVPNEANLTALFCQAMQRANVQEQAQLLVEVANMCLALADKNLGAQTHVVTCLTLARH